MRASLVPGKASAKPMVSPRGDEEVEELHGRAIFASRRRRLAWLRRRREPLSCCGCLAAGLLVVLVTKLMAVVGVEVGHHHDRHPSRSENGGGERDT